VDPSQADIYIDLGHIFYKQNNFDSAISSYEEALRLSSSHTDAYYYLGLVYSREQKYEEAIKQWEHYIALSPDSRLADHARKNIRAIIELDSALKGSP